MADVPDARRGTTRVCTCDTATTIGKARMSRIAAHRAASAAVGGMRIPDPDRRSRRHEPHLAAGGRRHLPDARHQSARAAERRRHSGRRRQLARPAAAAVAAGRDERALRQARAGRHRGRLEQDLPGGRAQVPGAEAGAVPRHDADGVRHRRRQDGAVLLPAGPEGLHRSRLLRGAGAAASRRRAISRRPTSSPTRSATTCRRCSASPPRCARRSSAIRAAPTRCRCAWSCRPTAWPACGPTAPTR